MDNNINKIAIVQLMKGNTAEYPITRPECVVFTDGTTASSRIQDLEEGVNVMYDAYRNGHDKFHTDNGSNPPMFKDKYTFHAYQSANLDNIKKSYVSILVKGVNNKTYDLELGSKTSSSHEGDPTVQVEETSNVYYNFSMKHFSSLMAGYVPNMIKVTTSTDETINYDRFMFMDTVVLSEDDASTKFGTQHGSVKALKLVMGLSDSNAQQDDYCELYFCPSCETGSEQNTYTFKCFITNPYIVRVNNG